MAREIAQKHQKQLTRIQKSVENAHKYFKKNIGTFHKFRKMVFDTSLTRDDIVDLKEIGKPPLEFNVLEAYISRLKGEFSKQTPSFSIRSENSTKVDALTIKVLESHFRAILEDANQEGFSDAVYNETLSGGYSVMKVWTEYEHSKSFDHVIRLGKVYDPTLTGFDPLARLASKADATYCYELYPRTKEEFERDYPEVKTKHLTFTRQKSGFNWSYRQGSQDIVLLCDFYEKKKIKGHIYYMADGQVLDKKEYDKLVASYEESIDVPPDVVQDRSTEYESVVRYRFIDDVLLEYVETDFDSLPLIFVDGNSAVINDSNTKSNNLENSKQMTRPYVYHAMDMQRLKNFAGQTLAAELENLVMHKFMVEESSIPDKYIDAWLKPQMASSLVWQSTDKDGMPLPKPEAVPRVPVPQEVFGTFDSAEKTIQNILGSYDSALGINQNQLSGVAIVEGATQSNSTAMPYVVNYLAALTQVGQVILELIPKYYKTPRSIPTIDDEGNREYIKINDEEDKKSLPMNLEDTILGVTVSSGPNFEVQKNRSLQTITQLMGASEGFKAMMEQHGLPILVDNLDIRGQEELKGMAREFMEEQAKQRQAAQQAPQQNPQAQLVQIEAQKAATQAKKQAAEQQYDQQRIALEKQKLELNEYEAQVDALEAKQKNMVALAQVENNRDDKATQFAMAQIKQSNLDKREIERILSKGE